MRHLEGTAAGPAVARDHGGPDGRRATCSLAKHNRYHSCPPRKPGAKRQAMAAAASPLAPSR